MDSPVVCLPYNSESSTVAQPYVEPNMNVQLNEMLCWDIVAILVSHFTLQVFVYAVAGSQHFPVFREQCEMYSFTTYIRDSGIATSPYFECVVHEMYRWSCLLLTFTTLLTGRLLQGVAWILGPLCHMLYSQVK